MSNYQPFLQVALPIMVTMIVGVWAMISTNNKRLDDIAGRLKGIEDRLLKIEEKVTGLEVKAWR